MLRSALKRKALLLSAAILAGTGTALAAETVIFSGGTKDPYSLFIGDSQNWGIPVAVEGETATLQGFLDVSTLPDNGIKIATWNGDGEAQLFFTTPEPVDMTGAVESDAALVMIVNVAEAPDAAVTLRMGCEYPCAANADISQLLQALPTGEWIRVSVAMRCFAEGGLDASNVDSPMLLLTSDAMKMGFADVRIVDGAGPDALISCR